MYTSEWFETDCECEFNNISVNKKCDILRALSWRVPVYVMYPSV